jgi:hypothetical protein
MSNINWTVIVFALLISVGAWLFVPSPLHKCPVYKPISPSGDTTVVHGSIPAPPDSGIHIGYKKKSKPKPALPSDIPSIPETMVQEEVQDTLKDGTIVNIRATTYIEQLPKDSIATYTNIEYNIQPKPFETDTVYITKPEMVEVEVPWIERPEVLVPVTIAATTLTIWLVLSIFPGK